MKKREVALNQNRIFAPKFMENQMFDQEGNVLLTTERSICRERVSKVEDQSQNKRIVKPGGGPHAHISPMENFRKKQEESSVK